MSNPWKWGDENQPKPEYKEPTGRHLCCGMDAEMRPFEKGDWVPYNDYAKLRMERIHDLNQIGGLQEENARLKSEVDALMTNPTSRLLRAKQAENAVLAIENDSLKAEVERLRKAGDEIIHEWSSGHGTDVENFTKALWVWAVAKEGKQS